MQENLSSVLKISPKSISHNVSLQTRTWIHRGGIARTYFTPKDINELITIGKYLYTNKCVFDIIGHTSNMYFLNSYNPDYIIDTRKLKQASITKEQIVCDCGFPMAQLSRKCISLGIEGYEGFINIPGTVAGAVTNNSGCYGSITQDVLDKIELLTPDGTITILHAKDLQYSERSSTLKRKEHVGIILRCYFKVGNQCAISELERRANINTSLRKYQHEGPSHNLGSVFVYSFQWKKNMRNILILFINKILTKLQVPEPTRNMISKYLLLTLYNKLELRPYISNKNLKCYLWKSSDADKHFATYVKLFNTFAVSPTLEIEVKK